jgi:hypothetical protein
MPGVCAASISSCDLVGTDRNQSGVSISRCCVLHSTPVSNWTRLQYSSASHHLLVTEELMAKAVQAAPKKDEPVAASIHTEKIESQVLEKVGKPPRLHRVEVCRHHGGNYRVNIWAQLEPMGDSALSMGVHIRSSYYLKVSDTGEIIRSDPPLTKLGCSA